MEIAIGTYEEVLLGLQLSKTGDVYKLIETFTDKSHIGGIKCVAISQTGFLASGGIDEIIHIFNLNNHRAVGTLTHHSGTITHLEFHQQHDLFSTSEDGTLCAWRVADWQPRTFKGHKGAVSCAAVHPSGKLALTIGQDKALRLWNLVDGRPAFVSNIKQAADFVIWSPDGKHYLVTYGKKIDIFKVEDGLVSKSISTPHNINSIVFVSDSVFACAGEGGLTKDRERERAALFFFDINKGTEIHQIQTESNRIRGLAICPSHEEPESGEKWLTSVSSDGTVSVHRVNVEQEDMRTDLIVSRNVTLRLTCVAVTSPRGQGSDDVPNKPKKQKKRKRVKSESNPLPGLKLAKEKTLEERYEPEDENSSDDLQEKPARKKRKLKKATGSNVPGAKANRKEMTGRQKMEAKRRLGKDSEKTKKFKKTGRVPESDPRTKKMKKLKQRKNKVKE